MLPVMVEFVGTELFPFCATCILGVVSAAAGSQLSTRGRFAIFLLDGVDNTPIGGR